MVKLLPILLLCSCLATATKAQTFAPEVWASAGDHYISADGSVSWTLGETVIETYTEPGLNIILTQGFQQPNFLKTSTSITSQPQNISPVFTVSPNPTTGIIRIKLSKPVEMPVQVTLFNTLGQLIQSDLWLSNTAAPELELSLENLANGVYFLQITMDGESLGVYKVQKDQR